jgi:hypothetical protein
MSSTNALILALRIVSIAFIAVAVLHLVIGTGADALLGVDITPAMASDPSIDSQNRFYGVTFSLLGIVLMIATQDLRRYRQFAIATLAVLFVAGLARVTAWGIHGAPSLPVAAILVADLLLPPVFYVWLERALADTTR